MTVTNKPNSGEPIVIKETRQDFGDQYIPTKVFWNFLDELTSKVNSLDAVSGGEESNLAALGARIAQVEYLLNPESFTIDSNGWTTDITRINIDMATV